MKTEQTNQNWKENLLDQDEHNSLLIHWQLKHNNSSALCWTLVASWMSKSCFRSFIWPDLTQASASAVACRGMPWNAVACGEASWSHWMLLDARCSWHVVICRVRHPAHSWSSPAARNWVAAWQLSAAVFTILRWFQDISRQCNSQTMHLTQKFH